MRLCNRLIPCLLIAGFIAPLPAVAGEVEWRSLTEKAIDSARLGQTAEAEAFTRLALQEALDSYGEEHGYTASSLNALAMLLDSQSRPADALPLYQRALAIRERVLGAEHPDTAISLQRLAISLRTQKQYTEAEPLYRRMLTFVENSAGPEHVDTAATLANLAEVFELQSRPDAAVPLYQRALAIREKSLGPEHVDTVATLVRLALLLRAQGQFAQAELCTEGR